MSNFRLPSTALFPNTTLATQPTENAEKSSWLPPEWLSDETMLGYFSSLDPNSKNTMVLKMRESRLAFWRDFVVSAFRMHPTLANVDPIISLPILKTLLRRNNLIPMGIPQIIDDMVAHKIIVPVNQFLNPTPTSWWSTLVGFVSSPKKEENTQYVLVPILEERIQKLMNQIPNGEAVMALSEFTELSNGLSLKLLGPMIATITTFEVKDQKGIKISKKQEELSDSDRALFHITTSVKKLEDRETRYAADIKSLRQEVVALLKSGNRPHAALLLRRAKLYEIQLDKAMKSRDQLLRIAASIEEAQTSAEVFEAMKLGAAALKTENARVGSIDKVDSLMDTVAELMEDQENISDAISSNSLHSYDESVLEAELAELAREDAKTDTIDDKQLSKDAKMDDLIKDLQTITVPVTPIQATSSEFSIEKKQSAVAQ